MAKVMRWMFHRNVSPKSLHSSWPLIEGRLGHKDDKSSNPFHLTIVFRDGSEQRAKLGRSVIRPSLHCRRHDDEHGTAGFAQGSENLFLLLLGQWPPTRAIQVGRRPLARPKIEAVDSRIRHER